MKWPAQLAHDHACLALSNHFNTTLDYHFAARSYTFMRRQKAKSVRDFRMKGDMLRGTDKTPEVISGSTKRLQE